MSPPRPPIVSALLVRLFFRGEQREVVLGDLEEGFSKVFAQTGKRREALSWYRWQALASVGVLMKDRLTRSSPHHHKMRKRKGDSRVSRWEYEARLAVRSLLKRPAFSFIVVLTVSLGVGANVTIFSVLNGVLLKPLPYQDPERLVDVSMIPGGRPEARDYMSYPDIADVLDRSPALAALVGYDSFAVTLTGSGDPVLIQTSRVTGSILDTFQLAPELGRDIRADECGPAAPRFALISHRMWRDRFDEAMDVVGRTLEVNGRAYEIVGVAPEGFEFPKGTQLWVPHRLSPERCGRRCHTFRVVGRLAPSATVPSAQAEADTIAAGLAEAYPESNTDKGFRVESLQDVLVGNVRTPLWILLAAVVAVLLIACANVANLLLVRASARRGEFAMRAALGASRRQLIAPIVMESVLLAWTGGVVGLLLAAGGVELLQRTSAGTLPRVGEIRVDTTVIAFALGIVVLVTLAFGSSPAAYLIRAPLSASPSQGRRIAERGRLRRRSRSFLVALEVALSMVLLIGTGLLLKSFERLYAVDLGFETRGITRFTLSLPSLRYPELEDVRTFYRTLEERLASLPGVESVGSIFGAPLGEAQTTAVVEVEGRPAPEPGDETFAAVRAVSPHYFETLRIPLIRGRSLEPADDAPGVPVGVVNQAFVRENFPTEDPVGQKVRVRTDMGFGSPYWTIVGIVGDIRSHALIQAPVPEVYVPQGRFGPAFMSVHIRSQLNVGSLLPAIRSEVHALDPKLPLQNIETVADAVTREVAPTRFFLLMLGSFAALALTLAAVGLYGVLAYLVSQRTREIGIRVAMGAQRGEILRMVLSDGLRPALAGIVLGLAVSLSAGRFMETLLYEVTARDPWTFAVVPMVLLVTALIASCVPARRAAQVDPVETLRAD